MADRILKVFYLTASTTGAEIPLPKHSGDAGTFYTDDVYTYENYYRDSVSYVFSTLHSGTVELLHSSSAGLTTVHGTAIPAGIPIQSGSATTLGPFRLVADPPRFLYSPKVGGEPIRVTVVLIK